MIQLSIPFNFSTRIHSAFSIRKLRTSDSRSGKYQTKLSTGGGTSDGRFIGPIGAQVVELGPVSESIHKVNEHIEVDALDQLTNIFQKVLQKLLT